MISQPLRRARQRRCVLLTSLDCRYHSLILSTLLTHVSHTCRFTACVCVCVLRFEDQKATLEVSCGFWMKRWSLRAPPRARFWKECVSTSAAQVLQPDPDRLLSCFLRCFIVLLVCLSVRQCEQPLQCEIAHLMGSDPVRYDLSGWFGQVQNNPSVLNASSLLQNSSM